MTHQGNNRQVLWVTLSLAATLGLMVPGADALAGRRAKRQVAQVGKLQTPAGLQGTRGAGDNVVFPFSLTHRNRRLYDVEAEYGWDVNGDVVINDGVLLPGLPVEYFPMTEDRRDERNTRRNKGKQLYRSAGGIGAGHSFVWRSSADIGTANFPTLQFQFTPDGRPVPDPDNPGSFLFAETLPGVSARFTATRKKGKKGVSRSDTVYLRNSFPANNNTVPLLTIDAVLPNTTSVPTASDEIIEILWTAYDDDSEDLNGNGVLDTQELEDKNGNGILDNEFVKIAMDYYRLQASDPDPQTMTDDELAALLWLPCTPAVGVGDPVTGAASAPPDLDPNTGAILGGGIQHTYAWDSKTDVGTVHADFLLRARPNDAKLELGERDYLRTAFTIDNWKIFNTAGPLSSLPGGAVGMAVVNNTPNLLYSDILLTTPSQSFTVFGGAAIEDGAGSNLIGVGIVNTETAETTALSMVTSFGTLSTPRSYLTATELDDGRVLVIGGYSGGGSALATTEIWNPVTRTIASGPSLNVARAKHSAVLLGSGDVAVFGGLDGTGGPLDSVEIARFSPEGAPQIATTLLSGANSTLTVAQHSPAAVLLPDLTVLVTGGINSAGNAVQSAQILDPQNDENRDGLGLEITKDPILVVVGGMNQARKSGAATPLVQGHVLFSGGSAPATDTLEIFNYETRTFQTVNTTMPDGGRAQHSAVRMGDGSVLIAGGTTDPDNHTIVGGADIFVLGAQVGNTWDASWLPVNGDMVTPRRGAAGVAINNGRTMFVGGMSSLGTSIVEIETFTPENGTNFRPNTRTDLTSDQQSWAFGARIVFRATDAEGDLVRVVTQWSIDGGDNWRAATRKPQTISNHLATPLAGLTTALVDVQTAAISPAIFPVSDRPTIWDMARDISRPPPGGTDGPYIFRNVPYGAVRGDAAQSGPVTVLFNAQVIPTIIPLENPTTGVQNVNQGGDISIWVHLRDIDGAIPGNGDDAEATMQFAIDSDNNGLIEVGQGESWLPMSRPGAGVEPLNRGAGLTNDGGADEVLALQTYSGAFDDPLSLGGFGDRPADKGWFNFIWDSVYDIGAPVGTFSDVRIRCIPRDNLAAAFPDDGLIAEMRNTASETNITIIRHPDALWLSSFTPAGGNLSAVAPNEPLHLDFNGLVDPASVDSTSLMVTRSGTPILGQRVVQQNVPAAGMSRITFYPQLQNTALDVDQYFQNSDPTILFPFNTYDITIPGYAAFDDLSGGLPAGQILPDVSGGLPPFPEPTYLLVNNVPGSASFSTISGRFQDGQVADVIARSPSDNGTVNPDGTFTLTFDAGIDVATLLNQQNVATSNVIITLSNGISTTIPGNWTIVNTNQPDGSIIATATFTPLVRLPGGQAFTVSLSSSFLSAGGSPLAGAVTTYNVPVGVRISQSITEDYDTRANEDTANTLAAWQRDACNPNVLTGLQDASTPPQGGNPLVVAAGQTQTITTTVSDFSSIRVEKGGTLRLRASNPPTIRATGDITIDGVVDFRGLAGYSGTNGNTSEAARSYYYASRARGTRDGGVGYNGADDGADSRSTTLAYDDGDDATGAFIDGGGSGGEGDRWANSTTSLPGGGGGAGGGHGTDGNDGGRESPYSVFNGWVPVSDDEAQAGWAVGDEDFANGISTGGSGGAGASQRWSGSFYHQGGAGGSAAGSVTMIAGGTFNLGPTGYIDGRGGDGGGSAMYAGSGGGGAGGAFWLKAGIGAVLDGVIDLRGGRGGPNGYSSMSTNTHDGAYTSGRAPGHYGGDGGLGRLVVDVVDAGNAAAVDNVRVYGQMMARQITSIPTTSVGAGAAHSGFGPGNATIAFGSTAAVHYSGNLVQEGIDTLTSTTPTTIFVDGDITINGTLRLNGANPVNRYSGNSQDLHFSGSNVVSTPSTLEKGGVANMGGAAGADSHRGSTTNNNSTMWRRAGMNAAGAQGGKSRFIGSAAGYVWSTYGYYYTGQNGGGGGGNASDGRTGYMPLAVPGCYDWIGRFTDTTGNGKSGTAIEAGQSAGGTRIDPAGMSVSNLSNASYQPGGGGGGNLGGYHYRPTSTNRAYYGYAGSAGSSGGIVAFVTPGTITVNGTIEAKGGNGNPPGAPAHVGQISSSWEGLSNSGGGAGAGGTVLLTGDQVNITTATSQTSSGAKIDLRGGIGGGWRSQSNTDASAHRRYPSYASFGNFGGDGGFGRLIVDYKTSFNNGNFVFNKYGHQQDGSGFGIPVDLDGFGRQDLLAGTAVARCGGAFDGNTYQSGWIRLNGLNDVVTNLENLMTSNVTSTIEGQGAPYQPHALTVDPTASGLSAWVGPGSLSTLTAYGFVRYRGTFARTGSTSPPPVIGETKVTFDTDAP